MMVISARSEKENLFTTEFISQVKLPFLILFFSYDLTAFFLGEMEGRLTEPLYKNQAELLKTLQPSRPALNTAFALLKIILYALIFQKLFQMTSTV